jgi:peroxiredoxin family protein
MNKKATLIVHSGDLDKVMSAFVIGLGALSMGMEVYMYFTFWGLERLKKGKLNKAPLSRMNMFGLGRWMIRRKMKQAGVASPDKMLSDFVELGGKILACDMTMEIMGVNKEALRDDVVSDYCGVGTYIKEAMESDITLFI